MELLPLTISAVLRLRRVRLVGTPNEKVRVTRNKFYYNRNRPTVCIWIAEVLRTGIHEWLFIDFACARLRNIPLSPVKRFGRVAFVCQSGINPRREVRGQ